MFTTIIVRPIFNVLVFIYSIIPGHNFGLAIILFTIFIRALLYPLVKKQLRQAKAMRELQPEMKKIKEAAKGNKQKESAMIMELYKEKEVNPFASIGIMIIQLPILIGLYITIRKIVDDPHSLVSFSYPWLQHLSWIQTLSHNIHMFDDSLFGVVNLTKTAVGASGGIYWPAMLIVAASAISQYLQSRQLMPQSKDARGLRQILRESGAGKTADQSEVNAAVSRSTVFLIPFMVFIISIRLAAALPLYWLVSSLVAYAQQSVILREDVAEAEKTLETQAPATEAEKTKTKSRKSGKKSSSKNRRRRKK